MDKWKLFPILSIILLVLVSGLTVYYDSLNDNDLHNSLNVTNFQKKLTDSYGYISFDFSATQVSNRPLKQFYNEYIVYDKDGIELNRGTGETVTNLNKDSPRKMHYSYWGKSDLGTPYKLVINTRLDKDTIIWNQTEII